MSPEMTNKLTEKLDPQGKSGVSSNPSGRGGYNGLFGLGGTSPQDKRGAPQRREEGPSLGGGNVRRKTLLG